jgi:hypothetical protein
VSTAVVVATRNRVDLLVRLLDALARGPGGYVVAVPLRFLADAYAAAVMVRASIRHRTLLL